MPIKKIVLILALQIVASLTTFSQPTLTDSICFSVDEARTIAIDLSRLKFLDSAIVLKDSVIASKDVIIDLNNVRIEALEVENTDLTEQLNKEKPKKKRWGVFGFLIGLATQLLF